MSHRSHSQASRQPPNCRHANACKLCAPLGACLALRGIEGALPFLHGSQGCATYMRRYIISHFREPMDIAASGFSEASTIFGGGREPASGPAQRDLAISSGAHRHRHDLPRPRRSAKMSGCCCVSMRPRATARQIARAGPCFHAQLLRHAHRRLSRRGASRGGAAGRAGAPGLCRQASIFPGMVSRRYALSEGGIGRLLPGNGPAVRIIRRHWTARRWSNYHKIPAGGTPIASRHTLTAAAKARIEFGRTLRRKPTAAAFLQERFWVPSHRSACPSVFDETDAFFDALEQISGCPTPEKHAAERGRLIDAYVDGHKYISGKRAVVYGEEDLVVGLGRVCWRRSAWSPCCAPPVAKADRSPSRSPRSPRTDEPIAVREGTDFMSIAEEAKAADAGLPDRKQQRGSSVARQLGVPLVRVGFPIHDRIGGQRILHLGYRGAQQLFDRIVNTLIESNSKVSPVGYSYM